MHIRDLLRKLTDSHLVFHCYIFCWLKDALHCQQSALHKFVLQEEAFCLRIRLCSRLDPYHERLVRGHHRPEAEAEAVLIDPRAALVSGIEDVHEG